MSAERDENVRMIRESAAAIAPRGDLARVRALRFGEAGFDRTVWREIATLGWLGLRVPEERGGAGLGMAEFCALAEELGAGLVPEPVIAAAAIAPLLPDDVLPGVLDGTTVVLPAWQEAANSLDLVGRTVFSGGRLDGTKRFVRHAREADAFLVTTRQGLALVRRDAVGVTVESRETQDGGTLGEVRFAGAPAAAVTGRLDDAFEEAALATAAFLHGGMERAFDTLLGYLRTRKQFGKAIGAFQVPQHRAVDLKIELALCRAVLGRATAALDAGADPTARATAVSQAKARVSEAALRFARDLIHMHGAIGMTDDYEIGLYSRSFLTLANLGGAAALHRARWLSLAEGHNRGPVGAA